MKTESLGLHDIQNVLVISTFGLGDALLSTPLPRALRKWRPGTNIDYLVLKGARSLLAGNPNIRDVHCLDLGDSSLAGSLFGWWRQAKLMAKLRKKRYDLVLDLTPTGRTFLFTWMTGAKLRVTIHHGLRTSPYSLALRLGPRKYQGEIYLDLIRALGIPAENPLPQLSSDPAANAKISSWMDAITRETKIALHPGGGWPGKWWPVEKYRDLAEQLLSQGAAVIIVWGPGEQGLAQRLAKGLPEGVVIPPFLALPELTAVLSRCEALVSGDSGPRHMAVALDCKTVGLFGPTWSQSWATPDPRHRTLQVRLGCGPCDRTHCADARCLNEIQVSDVLSVLTDMKAL